MITMLQYRIMAQYILWKTWLAYIKIHILPFQNPCITMCIFLLNRVLMAALLVLYSWPTTLRENKSFKPIKFSTWCLVTKALGDVSSKHTKPFPLRPPLKERVLLCACLIILIFCSCFSYCMLTLSHRIEFGRLALLCFC